MKVKWLRTPNRKLTLPDWLSIYRIAAAPFLLAILLTEYRLLFGCLLLLSFVTDALDGYFARKMKVVSQRGAQLDSIGDAITFSVGLVGILRYERLFMQAYAGLIVFAFGFYLLQLVMAYWRYGMPSSFHTYLAKLAAFCQGIFMVWTILMGIEYWLFYLVIVLSILETVEEIILILMFPEWKSDVKGLFWVLINRKELKV